MTELAEILETHNWFDYAGFYDRMAARRDFRVYVEVGCWKGHSVRHLARRLQERDDDAVAYAVDLWGINYLKENAPEEFKDDADFLFQVYNANLVESGVRGIVRDIRACSWDAADRFEDKSVDFVFIDADHSYDSVVRDIRAWHPKIRDRGIIAGHDYFNYSSVRRAVDEFFGDSIEVEGSIWFVDVSARPTGSAAEELKRRAEWLQRQRDAWIRATDERQAIIEEKAKALEWMEGQRLAWSKSAEQCEQRLAEAHKAAEDRIQEMRRHLEWTEDQRRTYEELSSSWRQVAEEREQALIELERVNSLLEVAQQPLLEKCRKLEQAEREASLALAEIRRTVEVEVAPEPGLKEAIKALFPRESFRGRVVRKLARMAKDPGKPENGRP